MSVTKIVFLENLNRSIVVALIVCQFITAGVMKNNFLVQIFLFTHMLTKETYFSAKLLLFVSEEVL